MFVLETKLHPPQFRADLVLRPRINALLSQPTPIKVLSAPPGFGKTTAILAWQQQQPKPERVAWLALDDTDNDVASFLTYLIAALQVVEPRLGEQAMTILRTEEQPIARVVITSLLNGLANLKQSSSLTLVIDDYHVITTLAIHDALNLLLNLLPPALHIIISSRAEPALPLGRWRANGRLTDLRADDLRFTQAEAAEFLQRVMQLPITVEDVQALELRTEGWIAGLQLAALSMRSTTDVRSFVTAFSGSHRYVVDYLADEVFNRQPPDVQDFLLKTALPDQICGDLCDALTGGTAGQAMLEQLERHNLFLIPLDMERRWYRYHHLFNGLLRFRLQRTLSPADVSSLYERTALWFESAGFPSEAIRYALTAKAYHLAARLIAQAAESFWQRSEVGLLTRWIATLPDDVLYAHPVLCIIEARTRLSNGNLATVAPLLDAAESVVQQPAWAAQRELRIGQIEIIRAQIARSLEDIPLAIELAQRGKAKLPLHETGWHAYASLCLAVAEYQRGNILTAEAWFTETDTHSRAAGDHYMNLTALGAHAGATYDRGFLSRAEILYGRLITLAQTWAGDDNPPLPIAGWGYAGKASLYRERHELAAAADFAQRGLDLGMHGGLNDVIFLSAIALARTQLSLGELAAALQAADHAVEVAESDGTPMLLHYAEAVRVRVWLAQGQLESARAWAANYQVKLITPFYMISYALVTQWRVWAADGQNERVLPLIREFADTTHASGHGTLYLELLVLQARLLAEFGHVEQALTVLASSFATADSDGFPFVQVYLDEGEPIRRLLVHIQAEPRLHALGVLATVNRLLKYFTIPLLTPATKSITHPALIEPISERELEVLTLMSAGLSNQEIADRLVISIVTVKKHGTNIFAKLGASSRTQAVARARDLGLLS